MLLGQRVKIPVGMWPVQRRFYHKGGYWTWEILVPGHTLLLFHKGNMELHSEGCVLVAERFEDFRRPDGSLTPGIADSAAGLADLMSKAGGRFTHLEVV